MKSIDYIKFLFERIGSVKIFDKTLCSCAAHTGFGATQLPSRTHPFLSFHRNDFRPTQACQHPLHMVQNCHRAGDRNVGYVLDNFWATV